MKESTEYYILFEHSTPNHQDSYGKIKVSIVTQSEYETRPCPQNLSDDPLEDFRISCQYNPSQHPDWGLYGWQAVFHSPYSVELHRAESMVKVLRKIGKAIEKYHQEWGDISDFAWYVLIIARALAVKGIFWKNFDGHGWAYSSDDWEVRPLSTIHSIIAQFKKDASLP